MYWRIDENGVIVESIGIPYDEKLRPRFHPDVMKDIIEIFGAAEIGDIYDRTTGAISKPVPIVKSPEEIRHDRMEVIRSLYIDALLLRDLPLAQSLEDEYRGLV